MQEITRVFLENEMDVILAHKRSIRLAELAGLTMSGQTTFATAVSEVSRSAMEQGNTAQLLLCIEAGNTEAEKFIVAQVREARNASGSAPGEGINYAQKLIRNISFSQHEGENNIELRFRIPNAQRINPTLYQKWITLFENDLPASPYEEIKRKNRQLVELAEKLRASEQQYRVLSETLPLLIFTWEEERGLTFVNKWTLDYTGYSLQELAAARWRNVIHPEEYDGIMAQWGDSMKSGAPVTNQMRMRRAGSGEWVWHLNVMIPQKNEAEEVLSWIGFGVDIHAQKMIEQTLKDNKELKAAQQQLEANQAMLQENVKQLASSNEELERFAYVASHDLQEPLRKIIVYSDYLKKSFAPLLDEKGALFFGNMIRSTSRMQQLIRDLLAFSTIGKEEQAHELVSLDAIAAEALSDLEVIIKEKGADIQIGALPPVMGNALQLRQLFENLLGNALKYSRPGVPPVIRIEALAAQGSVRITFRDNGIGFENQYVDKIFNLFQRLHTRDQYSGTGIGLAICRRVAELHGGSITAEGEPGEGAVFTVVLPVGGEIA